MESRAIKKYLAPAKINLSLAVTGKRSDGYHLLHSLTVFADFGDELTLKPADKFLFTQESEWVLPIDDHHLVVKTATRLAKKLDQNPNCHLHLKKNIPMGAGLGGGSSDAAATVRALLEFWNIDDFKGVELNEFLLSLGADVPVCYHGKTCIFEGVGEVIKPAPALPPLYAVLVYPNKFCSTVDVFKKYQGNYSRPPAIQNNIWDYLKALQNDLTDAAIENIPEIQEVLTTLNAQRNIISARMSGSGSCCFGVFETPTQSAQAAERIKTEHPEWRVKSAILI